MSCMRRSLLGTVFNRSGRMLHGAVTCLRRHVALLVIVILHLLSSFPARAAPAVTIGGPFELVGPDGRTVTEQTYRGKWLLVYFGYTSCPDSCPTALVEVAATLKGLGPEAERVQPILITIDPARDTPRLLSEYTQAFDPRIVGLTGTPSQIESVAKEYGAYFQASETQAEGSSSFDHSVYLYLMDPEGLYVRAFSGGSSSKDILSALMPLLSGP